MYPSHIHLKKPYQSQAYYYSTPFFEGNVDHGATADIRQFGGVPFLYAAPRQGQATPPMGQGPGVGPPIVPPGQGLGAVSPTSPPPGNGDRMQRMLQTQYPDIEVRQSFMGSPATGGTELTLIGPNVGQTVTPEGDYGRMYYLANSFVNNLKKMFGGEFYQVQWIVNYPH